jgi:uncharacterized damage-inducible protein DinB
LQPADFDRPVNYTNSQGNHFESVLYHIITQVTNHGTHHRGNIVTMIKEEGYPPPNLDYISYIWLTHNP